jgi:hypothetical protein
MLVRQGKDNEALQLGLAHTPEWASYGLLIACLQRRPSMEIRAAAEAIQPSNDPEMNYLSAGHLAYCGQPDAALEMLRQAIKGNYCSYPAIDTDPLFASLRTKPEFQKIRAAGLACQNDFLAHRGQ